MEWLINFSLEICTVIVIWAGTLLIVGLILILLYRLLMEE